MTKTSDDIAATAEWMRLQAACVSRSDAERARFSMLAEWLTHWAAKEWFGDDTAVRKFVDECLQDHAAANRLTPIGASTFGPVMH